jgi:hypothetical protein
VDNSGQQYRFIRINWYDLGRQWMLTWLVQGHKFVKFDDRIVVVDPASRLVVAMIPRYRLLP